VKLKIDFPIPQHILRNEWPSFFMMGSCFAQSQADRMQSLGFDVHTNPFGILYNPISIEQIIQRAANFELYTESDFEARDSYFSWEHHGDFKYNNAAEATEASNTILKQTKEYLQNADTIILTYGTSLVYTHGFTTVGNCHKAPNKEFGQRQLTFAEVKEAIQLTVDRLWYLNNNAEIIFTVSPIRHLRSGVTENNRSKAILLSAIHEVLAENKNTSYFPSYEIFVDELRDYRFAREDMTHPTEQAQDYIWQRFSDTYLSSETQDIIRDVIKFNQFASHRPIHTPELHQQQVIEKRTQLITTYPFLHIP